MERHGLITDSQNICGKLFLKLVFFLIKKVKERAINVVHKVLHGRLVCKVRIH